jgi:peptidoglycan/xylan/chitin deacetylase (PgdA/CDA1 family)
MNRKILLIAGIFYFLTACGLRSFPVPTPAITATNLAQPEVTLVPAASLTPSLVPTMPTFVFQGPNSVLVPILLYHHIGISLTDSQYYILANKFEEQMRLLRDWGYTTISSELLVKAIKEGADLPPRPVLITFDDGNLDTYMTAFPIMQKYDFTGVVYIVGHYMGAPEFMNADQIKDLARAGWEVGSHSMSHLDLNSLSLEQQRFEIFDSRSYLENELGLPVLTFSYPFGVSNGPIIDYTYSAGYIAAMGIGYTNDQLKSYLFTLQRRAINGTENLITFASLLPWQGDFAYLPTETLTPEPTATRTRIPTITLYPTSTSPP